MAPTWATRFMSNLVEHTAIRLYSPDPRECANHGAAARREVEALNRAHALHRETIGWIASELASLERVGAASTAAASTDGLVRALRAFRTARGGETALWLWLYSTTPDVIEQINFRATKPLFKLDDDQRQQVLAFACQASAYLEINYNRDFDAAGLAVTCDGLVQRGVATEADLFRVASLRKKLAQVERELAENGQRWAAAFDAMDARLED